MNKWLYLLFFLMLVSSIALSEFNEYYGAWAFYLLGLVMVIVAYLRKVDAVYFWTGLLIMGVTFAAANITSEMYQETSEIYREAAEDS